MKAVTDYTFFRHLTILPFVEAIWLYGSRARGDAAERADIDLAIICPTANDADWLLVRSIITNADTLLHIDCVRYDTLSEGEFKEDITKDKKVLFQR